MVRRKIMQIIRRSSSLQGLQNIFYQPKFCLLVNKINKDLKIFDLIYAKILQKLIR